MRFGIFCFTAALALFATGISSFAATATIGSIRIAPGGSRIEIQGDQPLTYLYRKMNAGAGILLDIAPGKTRGMVGEIPGSGHVTGIWVKELQVEGIPVTRLVIGMEQEMAVNVARDPADPGRLLVTFPSLASPDAPMPGDPHLTELLEPQSGSALQPSKPDDAKATEKKQVAETPLSLTVSAMPAALEKEIRPEGVAPSVVMPKSASEVPPDPGARPVVESLVVGRETVEIVTGSAATRYDSFRLNGPERLVIDLPGAAASVSANEVKIGKFGVSKARIGEYADKVRVVFDADSREGIPLSIIQKTSRGIRVTFAATNTRK